MKEKKNLFREGPFLYFTCTCGLYQATNPTMAYCGACGTEYTIGTSHVTLDTNKKTPRFALAKVIGKSGGLKIG